MKSIKKNSVIMYKTSFGFENCSVFNPAVFKDGEKI